MIVYIVIVPDAGVYGVYRSQVAADVVIQDLGLTHARCEKWVVV
jgi:hypothetical protein